MLLSLTWTATAHFIVSSVPAPLDPSHKVISLRDTKETTVPISSTIPENTIGLLISVGEGGGGRGGKREDDGREEEKKAESRRESYGAIAK